MSLKYGAQDETRLHRRRGARAVRGRMRKQSEANQTSFFQQKNDVVRITAQNISCSMYKKYPRLDSNQRRTA